jgi:peptidoglycan/xylan/chitin deacetylase (PgdA/CDA1 family)
MFATIQRFVRTADGVIAHAYLSFFRERGGLRAFLFHSLFRDEREIALHQVDPLQRTTVSQFRAFIEYYLSHGYQFVGLDDLLNGLRPTGKYVLISFDDGYFNNTLALPVLHEYKVPAVCFISTDNVLENKCFWWDVLYRERHAQGATPRQIHRETVGMKTKTTEEIESELKHRFGGDAFRPRGAIDRPFTPAELRDFAREPYVQLGNHTANHAILTNYTPDQARAQIRAAQDSLAEMTGLRPCAIAYPNGAYSRSIVQACVDLGLMIGFTVRPVKNSLRADARSPSGLRLGRFTLEGEFPLETQCRTYRSDVLLYALFRAGYLRLFRGRRQEIRHVLSRRPPPERSRPTNGRTRGVDSHDHDDPLPPRREPAIDELARRRPTFVEGTRIRLADGHDWAFPDQPPRPDDHELISVLRAIGESEDRPERLRGGLALAILLLSRNYDLTPADFQAILAFAPGDTELSELQRAVHELAISLSRVVS